MRGRRKIIKKIPIDGSVSQRQFIREYKNPDGSKDIWTYDLDKFSNGPISVEIIYNKNNTISTPSPVDYSKLPLTQRKWINPSNGKEIGYTRAKNLGLL